MTAAARPRPAADPITAPFWQGCAQGELRIQACEACGARWLPASVVCPSCWSDRVGWVAAAGTGVVLTYAVYRRSDHAAFRALVPYVVAIVALAEGPRLVTNLVGTPPGGPHAGLRVQVEFLPLDGAALPVFRPIEGGHEP